MTHKFDDTRTATEHLDNVLKVINPSISDIALLCDVSRKTIYQWIDNKAEPESDEFERVCALSYVADAFLEAGVLRADTLIKMKMFDGRTLMDLVSTGELTSEHVESLINEAHIMEEAYNNSGLSKSKANPSNDWQSYLSIPGSIECD